MTIAIVGAGVAGLGAAWRLRQLGHRAEIFEASHRVGGRVSTIERGPLRFDDGAQFIRSDTPAAEQTLLRDLPAEALLDIRRDVLPFDRHGVVGAGNPAQNAAPEWVIREGLVTLPRVLLRESGAIVRLGSPAGVLSRAGGGWRVDGMGRFDAVIVTAPPPAVLRLLERSSLELTDQLSGAFAAAPYRTIISVAFEPASPLAAPGTAYALVNTDRKHDVSWLAFEEAKPGYVPTGRQVVIAQMAHGWSASRLGETDRSLASEAIKSVASLLGASMRAHWSVVTRWPAALPNGSVPLSAREPAAEAGLFFAGDAFTGGRVHLALQSGIEAGEAAAAFVAKAG